MGKNIKTIYLAAGCFWGAEAYFRRIDGIISVVSGYANGKTETTDYERVATTDHAETVRLEYDCDKINLTTILAHYFGIIDPTTLNRQGMDIGRQYRTGIYYMEDRQREIAEVFVAEKQRKRTKDIVVEIEPIRNFIKAEEYHQNYLEKNPGGYCHINLRLAKNKLNLPEII